jgi:hypothetical protein
MLLGGGVKLPFRLISKTVFFSSLGMERSDPRHVQQLIVFCNNMVNELKKKTKRSKKDKK